MGCHFVRIGANEIALGAVVMRSLGRVGGIRSVERAVRSAAREIRSELLKLVTHHAVGPLVASRVLREAGLVTERVVAVLARAVKVRLVLAVSARREAAVFVKAEFEVALGNRLLGFCRRGRRRRPRCRRRRRRR